MKYCFDIDGTLFHSQPPDYEIIGYNAFMLNMVKDLYDQGHEIIIQTGRHWNYLQLTISQLNEHDIKYHSLVMGKPVADVYVDDKSMRPSDFIYA